MAKNYPQAFNWNGGKSKIVDWILDFFPAHRVYVEPFGGSGSILINKSPSTVEIFNDMDSRIINFFRVLREDPKKLIHQLHLTPYSREELMLDENEDGLSDIEKARRFVTTCKFDYREGRKSFKTARVGSKFGDLPREFINYTDRLDFIANRFKKVSIENRDALTLLKLFDSEDTLFYLDPPYHQPNKKDDDYVCGFTEKQHGQLHDFCKNAKGKVIVSGYDSGLYSELYSDFNKYTKETSVACFSKGVKRTECVWTNFKKENTLF